MRHALTVDLEEYFQVHALSDIIPIDSWDSFEAGADYNTKRILDLLDEKGVTSTFFCLGWIAERNKALIKTIYAHGHEIACHGYQHQLIYRQDQSSFRDDVSQAKNILEDCIGESVIGYRAPTYSITNKTLWALDVLEELGFLYDSSIFPIYHDNYGIPDAPRFPHKLQGRSLVEFPISTLKIGTTNLPVSGGGYFRLFPYFLTRFALKYFEKGRKPFVFYIHPWELNENTPRVSGASALSTFRTYVGISRSFENFSSLIRDFKFTSARNVLCEQGLLDIKGVRLRQSEAGV